MVLRSYSWRLHLGEIPGTRVQVSLLQKERKFDNNETLIERYCFLLFIISKKFFLSGIEREKVMNSAAWRVRPGVPTTKPFFAILETNFRKIEISQKCENTNTKTQTQMQRRDTKKNLSKQLQ